MFRCIISIEPNKNLFFFSTPCIQFSSRKTIHFFPHSIHGKVPVETKLLRTFSFISTAIIKMGDAIKSKQQITFKLKHGNMWWHTKLFVSEKKKLKWNCSATAGLLWIVYCVCVGEIWAMCGKKKALDVQPTKYIIPRNAEYS